VISSIIKCNTLIYRVYAIHTFNHGGEDHDSGVAGARKIGRREHELWIRGSVQRSCGLDEGRLTDFNKGEVGGAPG
jgi:hypothetical protein